MADLKPTHISRPRNPLIAEVFCRRGLVEQWGRGTQKIVDWCIAAGQPEPESEEQAGAVVVRFRPSGYHPPLRVSHDLTERQRKILLILSDRQRWKAQDIADALKDRLGCGPFRWSWLVCGVTDWWKEAAVDITRDGVLESGE